MTFELPPLPYALDALEPHISKRTLEFHHGKHHRAYVNKLNALIAGTPYEKMTLEEIILTSQGGVFNNAAQHWNHSFYWNCLSAQGGGEPEGALMQAITQAFGSFAKFKEQFTEAALNQFGSGWAWLVKDMHNNLSICSTGNAATPLSEHKIPLLTCDVWEHAYYLDTQNDRAAYVNQFWLRANWHFATTCFAAKKCWCVIMQGSCHCQ